METQLLQKYLQNECTSDEARSVLRYLATTDGQRQLQLLLETDLADPGELHLDVVERQQAQRLFSRIQARKQDAAEASVRPLRPLWRWMAAATVGLILLATGSLFFYRQFVTPPPISLHTDFGQTRRVVLPDQSVVTMNGNTTLRYFEHWKADQPREVWVEGEAFFEVVHTQNHQRFQVHLPTQMNVEVLGTRFNVYTRKTKTKVVLNEGRIQMRVADNPANHLEMKPGEMFFADTETKAFCKKRVNALAQSSWRTDKLIFEGTTLTEVAQLLKDTYGLDVEIRDRDLLQQKVTGTIPGKDANTILKGLSALFDLKITRKANHIIIE
ncbi:FecR family protein [Larkinella insperata]|uniref:FecR family protein n=1 Tax=Larkinella insperata TaxID=332158 RepID=A0ABW3QEH2_9BACT|nr:FecR domain-containing protein [Larkinella insperata]